MVEHAVVTPDVFAALRKIQSEERELHVGPREGLRAHALILRLAEHGEAPTSYAELAGWLAPLLATDDATQVRIHQILRQMDVAEAEGIQDVPIQALVNSLGRLSRITGGTMAWQGILSVVTSIVGAAAAFWWVWTIGGTTTPTEPITPLQPVEGGSALFQWIDGAIIAVLNLVTINNAAMVASVVAFGGIVRSHLRSLEKPVPKTPVLQRGDKSASNKELRLLDRGKLFELGSRLARLRLRRSRDTSEIDIDATVRAATHTRGIVTRVKFRKRATSVGHLILIDRQARNDHLGVMGDALFASLRENAVPAVSYDLLADPSRVKRSDLQIGDPARTDDLRAVRDHHTDDIVLVVASTDRLVDRSRLAPARWLMELGPPNKIGLLLPLPERDWGDSEAVLRRAGFWVGPLNDDALNDYVGFRTKQIEDELEDSVTTILQPEPDRRSWAFTRHAASRLDDAATAKTVSAMRATLSRDAYRLLCSLAVFPIVLPQLTQFLGQNLIGKRGPLLRTDTMAELSNLPWLRRASLPFKLRKALIMDLPQAESDDARALITKFQETEISADQGKTGAVLRIQFQPDGKPQIENEILPVDAEEALQDDPLLLAFAKGADLDPLQPQAAGVLVDAVQAQYKREQRAYRQSQVRWIGAFFAVAAAAIVVFQIFGQQITTYQNAMADYLAGFLTAGAWRGIHILLALGAVVGPLFLEMATQKETAASITVRILAFEMSWKEISPANAARDLVRSLPYLLGIVLTLDALFLSNPQTRRTLMDQGADGLWQDLAVLPIVAVASFALLHLKPVKLLTADTLPKINNFLFAIGLWILTAAFWMSALVVSVAGIIDSFAELLGWGLGCILLSALGAQVAALGVESGKNDGGRVWIVAIGVVALVPVAAAFAVLLWGIPAMAIGGVFLTTVLLTVLLCRLGLLLAVWVVPAASFSMALLIAFGALQPVTSLDTVLDLLGSNLAYLYYTAALASVSIPLVIAMLLQLRFSSLATFMVLAAHASVISGVGFLLAITDASNFREIFYEGLHSYALPALFFVTLFSFGTLFVPTIAFLWAREKKLQSQGAGTWRMGSPAILLSVPVFAVLCLSLRLTETIEISGLFFILPLAAFVTHVFGWWGAAAALIGSLPLWIQTGVSPTIILGWHLGYWLCVLCVVILVGKRGALHWLFLLNHLRLDTSILLMLAMGLSLSFSIPDIAFQVALSAVFLGPVLFFLIGLSAIPLRTLTWLTLGTLFLGLTAAIFWPVERGGPVQFGFISSNLGDMVFLPWTLALGRYLRIMTLRDMLPDAKRDGWWCTMLVRWSGNTWLIVGMVAVGFLGISVLVEPLSQPSNAQLEQDTVPIAVETISSFVVFSSPTAWAWIACFVLGFFLGITTRLAQVLVVIVVAATSFGFSVVIGPDPVLQMQSASLSIFGQPQFTSIFAVLAVIWMGRYVQRYTMQFRSQAMQINTMHTPSLWARVDRGEVT